MFLDFAIDQSIERRLKEMHILFSSNDSVEGVQESIEILSTTFSKLTWRTFHLGRDADNRISRIAEII
jgi:hypothetical protein